MQSILYRKSLEKYFQALACTQSSFSSIIRSQLALKSSLVMPWVGSFPKSEVW